MAVAGIDAMILPGGADLLYLVGYRAMPLERPTLLVLGGEGPPTLLVPELEVPRVVASPAFVIRPWAETDDPLRMAAAAAGDASVVAVGDQMWARHLLALERLLPGARFVPASQVMTSLRIVKDAAELDLLRSAAQAADRVVPVLAEQTFTGATERELADLVAAQLLENGHDEVDFAIVASGPNAASPHHETADRIVGRGETVVVDFGGGWAGYRSDTTRTFHTGPVSDEVCRAYEILRRAQAAAVAAARPGRRAAEIDAAARDVIDAAGLGAYFIHRTGHGIGLETHEEPYLVAGSNRILEPGMVFSIEPGIYLPGRWGMRIEDIVAVTGDGVECLNESDRRLYLVE